MISLYHPKEVRCAEELAMQNGDDSISMINRAAHALFDFIFLKKLDITKVLILSGSGNNGADGLRLAHLLKEIGVHTDVFRIDSDKYTAENLHYAQFFPYFTELPDILDSYTLIVDALFGIGFHGTPSTEILEMISHVNRSNAVVLSVDIPSGVSSLDGKCVSAIKADYTCAMNCAKPGHYLYPGAEYCGEITVLNCDIPLPQTVSASILTSNDLPDILPKRPKRSNKGTFGRIMIIAGCKGMAGAAYFSAKAALLCGCGLVEIVCPEDNRTILQTLLPEAILTVYENELDFDCILSRISYCNALVLGPGLGQSPSARILCNRILTEASVPAVVDADGLNLCANTPLLANYRGPLVITPHPGEAARLTNKSIADILSDPLSTAKSLSNEQDCTVLLKDAHTIISTGEITNINVSGNDGMATAGSGDLLSGIIASLLSIELSPHYAASCAALIHGLAGDVCAKKHGTRSVTASRIAECIEEVFKQAESDQRS